jgi:hypothetical protein
MNVNSKMHDLINKNLNRKDLNKSGLIMGNNNKKTKNKGLFDSSRRSSRMNVNMFKNNQAEQEPPAGDKSLFSMLKDIKDKVKEQKYDRRFHDIPTIEDLKKPLHKRKKKKKLGKREEAANKLKQRMLEYIPSKENVKLYYASMRKDLFV